MGFRCELERISAFLLCVSYKNDAKTMQNAKKRCENALKRCEIDDAKMLKNDAKMGKKLTFSRI
jgi:hypothetical protein